MTAAIVRPELVAALFEPCPYCSTPMAPQPYRWPTRDYMTPPRKGSSNDPDNLLVVLGGRGFKSRRPDQKFLKISNSVRAPVMVGAVLTVRRKLGRARGSTQC